ncbi:hypothetical protein ACFX11_008299 [Malus domestica]
MLQRLENASTDFKEKADLVVRPTIPTSLPQLGEKDDREKKKVITSQSEEAMADKNTDPFSEALVNMISMAWAEKGKEKVTNEEEEGRLADKSTGRVVKPPEYPKATIIKGMVLCSRCQCECELEIPPAGVLIDHELIKMKEEEKRKEACERARNLKKIVLKKPKRVVFVCLFVS